MNRCLFIILVCFVPVRFCLAQEWTFTYDASGNRTQRVYSTALCAPDEQQSGKKGDDEDETSSYTHAQTNDPSPENTSQPGKSKSGNNEIYQTGKAIVITPNPSKGKFVVQFAPQPPEGGELKSFDISEDLGASSITIYNVLGEVIFNSSFLTHSSYFEIDLSVQPKGIYMVKVVSGEEVYMERVVVE